MSATTVLIAELYAARYSNEKIGMLLPNYGGKKHGESTVRGWAMATSEPRASDWDALKALHADVFHMEHSQKSAIEVQQSQTEVHSI